MNTAPPKRILIIRIDRIGDMLTATPTLRAFRQAFPDARIDLAASRGNVVAVKNNPHVDSVVVFPAKELWKWPLAMFRLWRNRYDWVVELNGGSSTAALMSRVSGARVRASFLHDKTKAHFTITLPKDQQEHMIHKQLRLAAFLGAPSDDASMVFPVSDQAQRSAQEAFPRKSGLKRVGVFIGNAKKVQTRWPKEKFLELTGRMAELPGIEQYIIAGPGDEGLLPGFAWSERLIQYPGGSVEALGAFLKTCDMFVTSSSGPMHLASALDTPMVAILAGRTYNGWRPLADMHSIVRSDDPEVDVRGVAVDPVFEAVAAMLPRVGGA